MQLEYAEATDPGLDPHKRVNEDACGSAETPVGKLFVVCDGMGGHAGGKQASDIALRTIIEMVSSSMPNTEPVQALRMAIEMAARKVYEFGGPADNPQRPGSTCVAVLLNKGYAEVAHVGDSRAYAIRGKQIIRLTRDHSMVQDMIDAGALTEQQAIGHPDGNKITRALGMTPSVEVETRDEPYELFDGDVFILATDGLTDLARNEDILKTTSAYVKSSNVQTACNELVALANRRGGHDNITVQVVRVMRAGPKLAQTRMQEPSLGAGPTMMQGPSGYGGAPPTVMEEPYNPAGLDAGQRPFPGAQPEPHSSKLVYVILGMLVVVSALVGVLVWALTKPPPPPPPTVETADTADEEEEEAPSAKATAKPSAKPKPKASASASASSSAKPKASASASASAKPRR